MPDGFDIQALWGRTRVLALNQRMPNEFNAGVRKRRVARALRVARGPGPAMRLGHFVLHVSNHDESVDWLRERFGLLESDHFLPPGSDGPVVGTFLRLDAGSRLVDHHCLLVLQSQSPGVHHVSFEMQDLDDVMASHDHLAARGWRLDCGVGRHLLGSQIFDYWRDPFGFRVEHYTDGDVVDASHRPGRFNGTAGDTTQWGAMPPAEFFA